MTKLLVFDSVNLQTALLARQILDTNSDVWIFMSDEIPQNNQPVMFADTDNTSWLLNFCNLSIAALYQFGESVVKVCIPDVTQDVLMDRLLNKSNISLTSDTPCTIDYDKRCVRLDDTAGYSFVPFGDVNGIFVSKPIDQFYDFKFGHIAYRNMPRIDATRHNYLTADDILYTSAINGGLFAAEMIWYTNDVPMHADIRFTVSYANADSHVVDPVIVGNTDLYNRYIAHSRTTKQIKYIGPRTTVLPFNPFLINLDDLFDNIRKI